MSEEQMYTSQIDAPQTQEQLENAIVEKLYNSPIGEEKHNVHTFLHDISVSADTTKTGYLDAPELGTTPYSLRTYKKLALISDKICDDDIWNEFYKAKGEIFTATSLSKDAKLITLAVIQKREIADVTVKPATKNKGWFAKKEPQGQT